MQMYLVYLGVVFKLPVFEYNHFVNRDNIFNV